MDGVGVSNGVDIMHPARDDAAASVVNPLPSNLTNSLTASSPLYLSPSSPRREEALSTGPLKARDSPLATTQTAITTEEPSAALRRQRLIETASLSNKGFSG